MGVRTQAGAIALHVTPSGAVSAATARVNALCHERGIATAAAVTQLDNVQAIIDSGAQYLLYGTDLILLRREAQRAAESLAPFRKGRAH